FSYTISDGKGGTDSATVSVTVTPVNDPPKALNDSAATQQGKAVTISVLNNDSDVDNDTLTVTHVSNPPNGSATINSNGTITYTPDPGHFGSDSFTYTVSDGKGGTATASVSVTVAEVNDPPVAANDSASTPEDQPVTISVLAAHSDPDGNTLSIIQVANPSHGTAVISGTGIRYTPALNYNGSDSFSYTISDGKGGTDSATVSVTVTPVNDPPKALNDSAATQQGKAVTISVLNNDSDVDNDTLTVTHVSNPPNGSATINSNGTITYTPDPGHFGSDSFTYTVSDG